MVTAVALAASACAVSKRRVVPRAEVRPALEATLDELVERYNRQAQAVRSVNAGVELNPVAGSAYSGVIEDYHDVRGFLLAQRPAMIRLIGQAPVVGKNIFDMVSDGDTFRIFIPSKNRFLVGPAEFERRTEKPIENLRPQHLVDAIFWSQLLPGEDVLVEEFDALPYRYYVLTQLRRTPTPEIVRRIWFDRADLSLARVQTYGPGGRLESDVRYADWQSLDGVPYPRHIRLARTRDDYQLEIRITKLTLNEAITLDRFRLEQPPGTELVQVDAGKPEVRP